MFRDTTKAETLEWVNKVRTTKLDLDPLDELPKGTRCSSIECPIALAFTDGDYRGIAGIRDVLITKKTTFARITVDFPEEVKSFVRKFDLGFYGKLRR